MSDQPKFGEWRPIKTAPKDGTKILTYGVYEGDDFCVDPFESIEIAEWDEGFHAHPDYLFNREEGWVKETISKPTHWMPLPPEPKVQS